MQHIQIINITPGRVTEELYSESSNWTRKISKQMKHLIFVRREWKSVGSNTVNKTSRSSFRSRRRIPIMCPLASNSQIWKESWQKYLSKSGQIFLNLKTSPLRRGKNRNTPLCPTRCLSTIWHQMSADLKSRENQTKILETPRPSFLNPISKELKIRWVENRSSIKLDTSLT